MLNGFFSVQFKTPLGEGGGVLYLENGKLYGGDSALWYRGSYRMVGDESFEAKVTTGRHTPGFDSVFGKDAVTINATGQISGDTAKVSGTSPDAPGVTLNATMKRLA